MGGRPHRARNLVAERSGKAQHDPRSVSPQPAEAGGSMRRASERGVTLIELMIAITLVAALSSGMLMAIRTSLITLEKVDNRLQSNRRVISVNQILSRQLGGVMPVVGMCGSSGGGVGRTAAFNGTAQTLHLVSSFSL